MWFSGVLPTLGVTAAGAGAGSTASSGVTGEELKNCLCVSISIMLTLCFFFGGVIVVPAEVDRAAAGAMDAAGAGAMNAAGAGAMDAAGAGAMDADSLFIRQ